MRTELVTTLKRKATDLLEDVSREKQPILITQHGLPAAYLVDVQSYDQQQSRMKLLEGIARGERAIEDGRVLAQDQAKKKMARWLKSSGQSPRFLILMQSPTTSLSIIQRPRRSLFSASVHIPTIFSATRNWARSLPSFADGSTGNWLSHRAASSTELKAKRLTSFTSCGASRGCAEQNSVTLNNREADKSPKLLRGSSTFRASHDR